MERTLISINPENVITLWLIMFLGLALFGFVSQFIIRKGGFSGGGGPNSAASPGPDAY